MQGRRLPRPGLRGVRGTFQDPEGSLFPVELRQLQYLARIARVGGFRRAADELDMSQATLSEQIKLLEQEVGVRLFERGGRNLSLTEPGRALLERAERILEEVK